MRKRKPRQEDYPVYPDDSAYDPAAIPGEEGAYLPPEDAAWQPPYDDAAPADDIPGEPYPSQDSFADEAMENISMQGSWAWEPDPGEEEKPARFSIFKPRDRRPSFILGVLVHSFRLLVLLVLLFGLSGVGAVVGVAKAYMETAPVLNLAAIDDQAQTSFIYDASGNLITDYKGTENRIMVSIETMPLYLQHAFVAVEDARFYTHNGVDIKRIIGAFITNFVSGTNQGGSTITQQLIKNTLLSSEQSYKRKIQEAYLAMQLETRYTKQEIITACRWPPRGISARKT